MLTEKQLLRYFKQRRYGGRNLFARTLDYIALRVILFAAAFLFFRLHLDTPRSALLAALSLAVASLLLHVAREITMARFVKKEMIRIRRLLMREKLMFLPEAAFLELCRRAGGVENPIPMQRAEPVGADALLPLLRQSPDQALVICSSAGFTPAAEAFVLHSPRRARLIGPDALVTAAGQADALWPDDEAVHAYIAAEQRRRAGARRRLGELLRENAGAYGRKYALTAGILLLLSFFTRYTLYYRILAGLCLSIAAASLFRRHAAHPNPRS